MQPSPGQRFRSAVKEEHPLQVVGAITAYAARMAEATGFRALYLSGGGVAANSLGMPDLGISTMEDVLTDVRRITDVTTLPLLVDIDTGWGGGGTHRRPGGGQALRPSAGQGTGAGQRDGRPHQGRRRCANGRAVCADGA